MSPSSAPAEARAASRRALPWFGWLGLAIMALGWALTRHHYRPLSDYWYGLCWTGFSLFADGWVLRGGGRSLFVHRPRDAALMLVVSAVGWWGLEHENHAMHAWSYSPSHDVPMWVQRLRSTWFFATLVPSTWCTGLLALSLGEWRWLSRRRRVSLPPAARAALAGLGVALLVLGGRLPELALLFSLLGVALCLDPINHARGCPSLLGAAEQGDYRVPAVFAISAMGMGVVGEMWNDPASPKWSYDVPYIDFGYVFEMPVLGFLGYGLLSLTVFVVFHFARGVLFARSGAPARTARAPDPLSLTGL